MRHRRRPLIDRYWEKVDSKPIDPNGCWLWTAGTSAAGYGMLSRGGRGNGMIYTHRMAWEFAYGSIPSNMWVLHQCDVPRCVRPDHLFLGTQFDNMRDMSAKRRQWAQLHPERVRRGITNNKAKLTEDDVHHIRQSGESNRALARRLGVNHKTVSLVRRGLTWKHVI